MLAAERAKREGEDSGQSSRASASASDSRQQRYSVSRAQRQRHQQQHDHHQQRKPYTVTDELQQINAGSDWGPQCGKPLCVCLRDQYQFKALPN